MLLPIQLTILWSTSACLKEESRAANALLRKWESGEGETVNDSKPCPTSPGNTATTCPKIITSSTVFAGSIYNSFLMILNKTMLMKFIPDHDAPLEKEDSSRILFALSHSPQLVTLRNVTQYLPKIPRVCRVDSLLRAMVPSNRVIGQLTEEEKFSSRIRQLCIGVISPESREIWDLFLFVLMFWIYVVMPVTLAFGSKVNFF